jgi:hypothetical protein
LYSECDVEAGFILDGGEVHLLDYVLAGSGRGVEGCGIGAIGGDAHECYLSGGWTADCGAYTTDEVRTLLAGDEMGEEAAISVFEW